MQVQAFVSKRSVERFHVAVIRRPPGAAEIDPGFVVVSPQIKYSTREFATVVHEQVLGGLPLRAQAIQRCDHMLTSKPLFDLDGERFPPADATTPTYAAGHGTENRLSLPCLKR
jgi:hypothetical protein